jgi:hypothetical protein
VPIRFYILAAIAFATAIPLAAEDPLVARALPEIAKLASDFWHSAPDFMARETMKQKALSVPKRHVRIGAKATEPTKPTMKDREIVSYYAISFFNARRESLHEFRQIVSVDGKDSTASAEALAKFRATLDAKNDKAKQSLLDNFEKATLSVAATDFGQLVLLFTRANLPKYNFDLKPRQQVGADRALVIAFQQNAGGEALRITEPGRKVNQPLSGELWVRESDYQPLRITLTSTHLDEGDEIRDEARVDYAPRPGSIFLPASVTYRRYLKNTMIVENIAEYSDWRPVNKK